MILHHITLYTLIQTLVTNSQGSINIQVKMKDPLNLNLELRRLLFLMKYSIYFFRSKDLLAYQ